LRQRINGLDGDGVAYVEPVTAGGLITGNQVVPCSWEKPAQGGPMIAVEDNPASGSAAA
jgi:hypothetical protein